MKQYNIIKLVLLLVLYNVFANAKINWAPIIMGDITTFAPYGQTNELKTLKDVYKPNDLVSVKVNAALSGDQDWVGVYHKNASSAWKNVVAWNWVPHNGTFSLTESNQIHEMPVGAYEARLFFHNSVQKKASYPFSVAVSNFQTTKTTYAPNETVSVTVNVPLSGDKDWVGVYHKNASSAWENVVAWNWVPHNGTITLTKNNKIHEMPVGDYEIRLFFHNNVQVQASYPFSVGGDIRIYPPETIFNKIEVNPRVTRPAKKFASYIDSAFDNIVQRKVTRITNREKDKKGFNGYQYPKQGSAWNSDMTLLRLIGRIYDAETLKEIPLTKNKLGGEVNDLLKKPESGASGIRWSKHNPNVLYVMSGENKFYKLTINANRTFLTEELIIDLSNMHRSFSMGGDEGNIDYEDRYVVLTSIEKDKNDDVYAVLLDIKAKHLVWGPRNLNIIKDNFDWMSISPSGNYIVMSTHEGMKLYNRNFEEIRMLANEAGHGDICYDQNGNEMYAQFRSGGRGTFGFILNNSHQYQEPIKLLDSNYGDGHISCRNYKRKGWAYLSTREHGYREVFALKLDGSKKVQRFAKTYARGEEDPKLGNDFYTARYPFGVPSPDGTRILFKSDYGNPEKFIYGNRGENDKFIETSHYKKIDSYQVQIN